MKLFNNNLARIAILATVSFLVILPILIKGLPTGYDLPHHFQTAMTFVESIRSGDLYPSWSLERNFGYGGMEVRLYPPISHYTLALTYLVVNDWHIAACLTILMFTFVGALGVYLWAGEYVNPAYAVFAGTLFALLPYHLNQIYNTFFFAEYAGTSVMPFTFYFISKVVRRGRPADIIGLGVSLAALILTHLPLTVIGGVCFSVFALAELRRGRFVPTIAKLSAGVGIALAASSFFWIKVLQERDLLAKTDVYTDPWLDYRLHFLLTPFQHFQEGLQTNIYENSTFFYDLMFYCAAGLAVVFSVALIANRSHLIGKLAGVFAVFGAALFLITPVSRPVWDRIDLLQEVQFPWRWVAVICITAPLCVAGGLQSSAHWLYSRRRPWSLILAGCVLAVITFSISQIIRPAPFIPTADVESRVDALKTQKGATFWWTMWTRREAFDVKDRILAGDRSSKLQNWTADDRTFEVGPGSSTRARLAVLYHPDWRAEANGVSLETSPDANGSLLVTLPAGAASVHVHFEETALSAFLRWVSASVWVILLTLGTVWLWRRYASAMSFRRSATDSQSYLDKVFAGSTKQHVLILIGLAGLTIAPMYVIGVYNGGDLYQHAQFASTFFEALKSGTIFPAWAANENLGYGGLGVRMYPPLVPFLWATFRILFGDWHTAVCVLFFAITCVGNIGVYLWAREYVSAHNAVWAGLVFNLMPYHFIEIQNASMYAEYAGAAVIPFCFLFVFRTCKNGDASAVLGLSISYAALTLTHLPTSVIGAPALLLYSLWHLERGRITRTVVKLATAVCIGLAGSSAYWSRMVTEQTWMRNTKFWPDGHFDYRYNFLLTTNWFDGRNLWFFDSVYLLLLVLVSGVLALAWRRYQLRFNRGAGGVLSLFAFSMVMCTVLSYPVWRLMPYLKEVQFPWRWLTIGSSSAAVLAAIGVSAIREHWNSESATVSLKLYAGSVLVLFAAILTVIAIDFQLTHIPAAEFNSWVDAKSKIMGAEWFWTTSMQESAFDIRERVITGERKVQISSWDAEDRTFVVRSGAATTARIATMFYPYWRATVNDEPVQVRSDSGGAISIAIPPEPSKVHIFFEEPAFLIWTRFLTMITWIGFFVLLVFAVVVKFFPRLARTLRPSHSTSDSYSPLIV